MDGIIGKRRKRSEEFEEISAYDVLTTLKSGPNLRKNEHNLDLSVVPVELKLPNSGRLEKNGDLYIVRNLCGISFIIRKIDDKRLDVRDAMTSNRQSLWMYIYSLPHISFWYVDIDKNSNSVNVRSINDKTHDPKVMEDLFRQYLK